VSSGRAELEGTRDLPHDLRLITTIAAGFGLATVFGFVLALLQAPGARAAMMVVATPDTVDLRRMVDVARQLNPKIDIVLRTHSDDVAELLRGENLGTVFMGDHELAKAMTRHGVERMTKKEPV